MRLTAYRYNMNEIICGDALTELRKLPDESVHCCVTSPPYWGLRDYGTAKWEGGDAECDHKNLTWPAQGKNPNVDMPIRVGAGQDAKTCPRCGAHRIDTQLGLEKTPGEYVTRMVETFHEVRRVLRDDGTLWLNLGDSYVGGAGRWGGYENMPDCKQTTNVGSHGQRRSKLVPNGFKPKDLCGIPWRVAFALQADGWYLRSDIIWAKPNPMPESVRDRPTRSHEYIFLMSKSAQYYFDQELVKELANTIPHKPGWISAVNDRRDRQPDNEANLREWAQDGRRNIRSVWVITTKPFKEAHFATFPPEIPERCIKAGCPVGGIVLDPFFGAGTTGMVAKQLGRNFIGIELNPKYCEMAERRIAATVRQEPKFV